MEKSMLVLVLDPEDLVGLPTAESLPDKQIFGIVQEVLDSEGRYQDFRCMVRRDDGTREILAVGRLSMLIMLSEEEARALTPTEAFEKWSVAIVKKLTLRHLPEGQRDFLSRMALNAT